MLNVQRGESSRRKLSGRARKNGLAILVALLLGLLAYSRYRAGDIQTAEIVALIGFFALILGLRE